ncbi:site-specific integrase [Vibrio parahaemolyticus]|uniref:site-specific integrase n=1 Tax=Vibrio parahaemolyticus TaxID=670 RepID=UPI00062B1249|nr:site-specific integrase [Vibrio parahaemolyticus]EGQ9125426.1 tyrosine-type recombinase/integrase [Vibrio parahaemolyticus]EGR1006531.1 site-specific integrase [Vibrio parahaemolyticus]EGR1250638.1 site-specific integrase [Vibrio parahaemolyticus]EGR3129575.1 site-specific integrase [Vibrio parahaemolyticus]EGR9020729.1 site-specific integrase [Vibrio parahaemolyticus]
MKVSVNKRNPNSKGLQQLRLVYYYGVVEGEDGKKRAKRDYEPLELYLYENPKTQAERQHNKEMLRQAEASRSARLVESHSNKFQLEDRVKLASSFYEYYDKLTASKESGSSSNYSIWISAGKHLRSYHGRAELTFEELDKKFLEGFRKYLLEEPLTKSKSKLAKNTASSYFNKVRAALNEAYREGIIRDNPVQRVKSVKAENTQRTYLTLDEVRAMTKAECRYDVLKRAFLFSCTTGLRWSDIQKLTWKEIEEFQNGHYRIIFKQTKLLNAGNSLVYLDLPDSAVKLMGERQDKAERVFKGLKYSSYTNVALLHWAMLAGVQKHVTFHVGRHTFAVAQLNRGVDIYSLSRLLGHSELRTTEIYADILESRRVTAMRGFPDIFEDKVKESGTCCPHCGKSVSHTAL